MPKCTRGGGTAPGGTTPRGPCRVPCVAVPPCEPWARRSAQRRRLCLCLWALALCFDAEGKGILGVTAPALPEAGAGTLGRGRTHGRGYPGTHGHMSRIRLPLPRRQQPRPWDAAGRGCRSSRSSPLPGLSRSPGIIFGSASLPSERCRLVAALLPRTRARDHPRMPVQPPAPRPPPPVPPAQPIASRQGGWR